MNVSGTAPEFRIIRAIVVRVSGELDATSTAQLERILYDLIVDQGVANLTVDLSETQGVGPEVTAVLETARRRMDDNGGTFAVRVPSRPATELKELAEDVAVLAPLDLDVER